MYECHSLSRSVVACSLLFLSGSDCVCVCLCLCVYEYVCALWLCVCVMGGLQLPIRVYTCLSLFTVGASCAGSCMVVLCVVLVGGGVSCISCVGSWLCLNAPVVCACYDGIMTVMLSS